MFTYRHVFFHRCVYPSQTFKCITKGFCTLVAHWMLQSPRSIILFSMSCLCRCFHNSRYSFEKVVKCHQLSQIIVSNKLHATFLQSWNLSIVLSFFGTQITIWATWIWSSKELIILCFICLKKENLWIAGRNYEWIM